MHYVIRNGVNDKMVPIQNVYNLCTIYIYKKLETERKKGNKENGNVGELKLKDGLEIEYPAVFGLPFILVYR